MIVGCVDLVATGSERHGTSLDFINQPDRPWFAIGHLAPLAAIRSKLFGAAHPAAVDGRPKTARLQTARLRT
jgi:hypothetical protein